MSPTKSWWCSFIVFGIKTYKNDWTQDITELSSPGLEPGHFFQNFNLTEILFLVSILLQDDGFPLEL